jgi:5-methylcytosine-specific restriction endonuclease McrA
MPEISPSKACSIEGCGKPIKARGLCNAHWIRLRRHGDPLGTWGWHESGRLKKCIACGESKPLSEFYAYGYTTRLGKPGTRYDSRCRPCAQARRREAYHADPEGESLKHRRWNEANAERIREWRRERQKLPETKALKAYHQRLRKARMRSGANDNDAIRAIYAEAMRVERIIACCPVFDLPELGKKMHVDHIIPLARGGKHEADNLQILPIGINMRKGVKCRR